MEPLGCTQGPAVLLAQWAEISILLSSEGMEMRASVNLPHQCCSSWLTAVSCRY